MFWAHVKNYLPRTLFGRAALIYFVPVLTILGVMSVVFIQRLYEDVTRQMTNTVADEVALIVQRIDAAPDGVSALVAGREVAVPLGMRIEFDTTEVRNDKEAIDLSGETVIATLRENLPDIGGIDLATVDGFVRFSLPTSYGETIWTVPRSRFSARNPHQFLVLIGTTAVIMTLIALLYLRNQVRPIRRLAAAASAFGKGRVVAYHPQGAAEVREAGQAFLQMRDRIERQIEQRTMMLSGVSHDLRTPLTRMRLAVDMMENREEAEDLTQDIVEMEQMLATFLDFARLDSDAEMEAIDVAGLAKASVEKFLRSGHDVSFNASREEIAFRAQPMALSRAIENLISNAVRYGTSARVSVVSLPKQIRLLVEDDGPGIPEKDRGAAEKPFSRLDPARNQDGGSGVGLGLAITKDIARRHGGQLILGESEEMGGLAAEITLPR